jgi:hypothetical protein
METELILSLAIEITDAFDASHAKGNIHQDVKLATILFLRCLSKSFCRTSSAMNSQGAGFSPSYGKSKGATPKWGGEAGYTAQTRLASPRALGRRRRAAPISGTARQGKACQAAKGSARTTIEE